MSLHLPQTPLFALNFNKSYFVTTANGNFPLSSVTNAAGCRSKNASSSANGVSGVINSNFLLRLKEYCVQCTSSLARGDVRSCEADNTLPSTSQQAPPYSSDPQNSNALVTSPVRSSR